MKAEINNENKAKFFAQYLGQKVAGHECDRDNFELTEISILDCEVGLWGDWSGGTHPQTSQNDMIGISDVWLNLKPLSSISDEDAIEAIKTHYDGDRDEMIDKSKERYMKNARAYIISPIQCILPSVVDFLRFHGYLVPWMGLSCEEIIEAGWAKYREA